ncbi:MAG: HAMP domain-containing sensor histidine kinase [Saprospiraceae bacterium]
MLPAVTALGWLLAGGGLRRWLADLPPQVAGVLSLPTGYLWIFVPAGLFVVVHLLLSIYSVQRLVERFPAFLPRFTAYLTLAALSGLGGYFLPGGWGAALLCAAATLLGFLTVDAYRRGDRASMTWFVFWSIFYALVFAGFCRSVPALLPPPVFQPLLALTAMGLMLELLGFRLLYHLYRLIVRRPPLRAAVLPLVGPPSLRLRIQVAFFLLCCLSFLFIGLATYQFLRGQTSDLRAFEQLQERMLTIYFFLLLVSLGGGILLANTITEPLLRITGRFGDVSLRGNQPIDYRGPDEIGRLVAGYNRMIGQVEESATRLARSEREQAWREVARQVSHEITNALTPMKLHLQQLQRLLAGDPERARDYGRRAAPVLVEQIDMLARIAGAFRDFSHLPRGKPVRLSARTRLLAVHELHRHETILPPPDFSGLSGDDTILIDPDQLQRVLTNLIRNAIQAAVPERAVDIRLSLRSTPAGRLRFTVADNGSGIPPALAERVFEPSFSSKSSGMGLGLAMSRRLIEAAGGSIGFEDRDGGGTVFWVEVPLVND